MTSKTTSAGGWFARLAKTRERLFGGGGDAMALDELSDRLLMADVGVEASEQIIERLRRTDGDTAAALRAVLVEILAPCARELIIDDAAAPFVILMVGVNGSGKTTTTAKIAGKLSGERDVVLAACDTFRAAAIEQLQTWGAQLDVPVIAQAHGADAAAVAHDAYNAARARGADVLLIDTAGRQHTHEDLMAQLQKIKRVLGKAGAEKNPPHEILLTLDAGNGYNALSQVEHFKQAVGVDGLCITKLDGTAKGGVVVALAQRFGLPIRFVCGGQTVGDIGAFSAEEFVDALLLARD